MQNLKSPFPIDNYNEPPYGGEGLRFFELIDIPGSLEGTTEILNKHNG